MDVSSINSYRLRTPSASQSHHSTPCTSFGFRERGLAVRLTIDHVSEGLLNHLMNYITASINLVLKCSEPSSRQSRIGQNEASLARYLS
jgi:hypothetical protein